MTTLLDAAVALGTALIGAGAMVLTTRPRAATPPTAAEIEDADADPEVRTARAIARLSMRVGDLEEQLSGMSSALRVLAAMLRARIRWRADGGTTPTPHTDEAMLAMVEPLIREDHR